MTAPGFSSRFELPGVSWRYLRPRTERGRTNAVVSTDSGSTCFSSLISSSAVTSPVSLGTGSISAMVPTRAPPMFTSFPFTRLAASGGLTLRS